MTDPMIPQEHDHDLPPRVSVVIPVHNGAYYLSHSLPALAAGWNDAWELLVVDDASDDGSADIAREAGATVIRLDAQQGPSGARNAGVAEARGQVLIFIDADVMVRENTISKLVETLEINKDLAAVFGSYDDAPADQHVVSTFKNLMHHYLHQQGSADAQTFWTGCGALRRKVYDEVGPFQGVSFTCVEDIDYGHRLRAARHRILLHGGIQVKHLKRWTLPGLIRTDVMHRGIPWTVMMLRRGRLDTELNLGWSERLSAVFALLFMMGLTWEILSLVVPELETNYLVRGGLFLGFAGYLFLQRKFFHFLAGKRGVNFLIVCIPLHLLYTAYSVLSLALGTVVWLFTRAR